MRKMFYSLFVSSLISISAFAQFTYSPSVMDAKIDAAKELLTVTVKHSGGCGEHNYKLQMERCLETFPVQCTATITDTTDDMCEALLIREAVFTFKELGLNDSYFNGATIHINGAKENIGGELIPSSATVVLPFKN